MFFSPFNNVEQIDRLHAPANSTAWNPLCHGVTLALSRRDTHRVTA